MYKSKIKIGKKILNQEIKDWHTIEADSIIEFLNTSKTSGLSSKSALERLLKYGQNLLPEPASRSEFSIFIEQFKSLPVALLTCAAIVSTATGGWVDALVIMGVVAINAIIGYFTESQSEKLFTL